MSLVSGEAENDEEYVDDVDVELHSAGDVVLGTQLIRSLAANHQLRVEH